MSRPDILTLDEKKIILDALKRRLQDMRALVSLYSANELKTISDNLAKEIIDTEILVKKVKEEL